MSTNPSAIFRRAILMALVAAALVSSPTLFLGFTLDDYILWDSLENPNSTISPFDLVMFVPGDEAGYHRLVDNGPYPWWTLPDLKMAFCRPLAMIQIAIDHRLFPRWALPHHIHCLLWYLALVASCALVLRSALPGSLAILALLLYAIDDAHALSVSWIANLNQVEA